MRSTPNSSLSCWSRSTHGAGVAKIAMP
jgi:hypothetical protein